MLKVVFHNTREREHITTSLHDNAIADAELAAFVLGRDFVQSQIHLTAETSGRVAAMTTTGGKDTLYRC